MTTGVTGNANPVTMRIMIIQDRNFEGVPLTSDGMFRAIFGTSTNVLLNTAD